LCCFRHCTLFPFSPIRPIANFGAAVAKMGFFSKQLVDDIGILGVKLQKILLFLGFVAVLSLFSVRSFGGLLSVLFTFVLLWCGFWGAYKRRERLLRCYYVTNIMLFILGAVFILFVLIGLSVRPQTEDADAIVPPASNSTDVVPQPAPQTQPYNDTEYQSGEAHHSGANVVLMILMLILGIMVFAYKIISIILAAKLSHMLRRKQAESLAHPPSSSTRATVVTPQAASAAVVPPAQEPSAPQPYVVYVPVPVQPNGSGFAYHPMQIQQQPQPMMWNPYATPVQPQQVYRMV